MPPIDLTASRRPHADRQCAKGVVCCSQPLAAEAGIAILRAGGNAADAVVAMAAALNVTEPVNTGIGGDAFALYWDAKARTVTAVNGSGRSAQAMTLDKAREFGLTGHQIPYDNVHTCTVPGAAAAMVDIQKKLGGGKLSLAEVLQPAISLAEDGFAVHQMASFEWRQHENRLLEVQAESGYPHPMLVNGKAPVTGQFFSNPQLGATLRKLGAEGKDAFYKGPVAEKIVQAISSRGGLVTLDDLAAHDTEFTDSISYTYGKEELTVHECPPNGQGLATLIALGVLDVLHEDGVIDLDSAQEGSVEWYHAIIEALRIAFADTTAYVADRSVVKVPVDQLLSKANLRERAKLFNPHKATPGLTKSDVVTGGDTCYLAAADSKGNAISYIMSNYLGFGSAIAPEGCGFTLQNRGCAFSLDPASPNVLAGSKRPFHTIIPAMVTKGDELFMSYGCMGAIMQPQGQALILLNLLHNGRDPQLALDAKRFCIGGTRWHLSSAPFYNGPVALEDGVDPEVADQLEAMGHEIERVKGADQLVFGKGQAILRTVDAVSGKRIWAAGTDYRGDGCAVPQI